MKKILIRLFGTMLVTAALLAAAVTALNEFYYKNVFPMGVWINGIYCTGMTPQEVTARLDGAAEGDFKSVNIHTLDGLVHTLQLDAYGVSASYAPVVENIYHQNRGYSWLTHFAESGVYQIAPEYSYDLALMKEKLGELDWLNDRLYNPENSVSIVKSAAAGYILVDETKDLLLKENAVELICEGIVNELTDIDLSAEENKKHCYQSIPYTDEMKDTLAKWEGVRDFQGFQMTYLFGDRQEIIDENVVCDWMALDGNGDIVFGEDNKPVLDASLIQEYIEYLSMTYDTVGVEREFQATSGKRVTVAGGSYGNAIDTKEEYAFLLNAFLNGESGTRVPAYRSEVWEKGADDIGDTYVEVDMGAQHMYYYKDGEIVIDTPVVTGNRSRGWDTPAKVCYVYFKQQNRVLRGRNYATPVKYWMAVDGNIGIHDATWRKEFGGDIYLTDGSHGCINTPLEIMSEMYEVVEKGTPVILFY